MNHNVIPFAEGYTSKSQPFTVLRILLLIDRHVKLRAVLPVEESARGGV
jgi:hypothetical protein